MRAYISVTVCGKITPVILHGVVSPERTRLGREEKYVDFGRWAIPPKRESSQLFQVDLPTTLSSGSTSEAQVNLHRRPHNLASLDALRA